VGDSIADISEKQAKKFINAVTAQPVDQPETLNQE
jgi:hypothetical protein